MTADQLRAWLAAGPPALLPATMSTAPGP
jgi:hypothetical protein